MSNSTLRRGMAERDTERAGWAGHPIFQRRVSTYYDVRIRLGEPEMLAAMFLVADQWRHSEPKGIIDAFFIHQRRNLLSIYLCDVTNELFFFQQATPGRAGEVCADGSAGSAAVQTGAPSKTATASAQRRAAAVARGPTSSPRYWCCMCACVHALCRYFNGSTWASSSRTTT